MQLMRAAPKQRNGCRVQPGLRCSFTHSSKVFPNKSLHAGIVFME